LQQATARAEALMTNAAGGSLDNLLLSNLGASQFLGVLNMLDPAFYADRWRAIAVAASEVIVIKMTREGLDTFLGQNPLAQVHLRASMARARAEITKLESLERIANVQRRRRNREREQRAGAMPPKAPSLSKKMSDVGKLIGVTLEEAVNTVRPLENAQTATMEMFALVSRLREGMIHHDDGHARCCPPARKAECGTFDWFMAIHPRIVLP